MRPKKGRIFLQLLVFVPDKLPKHVLDDRFSGIFIRIAAVFYQIQILRANFRSNILF